MSLLKLKNNAKNLTPNKVRKDVINFLKSLENELAQYNKAQLFIDSSDVEGKSIGFYSPNTEVISRGKKKAGQPFNLYDTGDFLKGVFAKVQSDSIFFDTTDSKKQEVLNNLLSKKIFGLTEENIGKTVLALTDFLQEYYLKSLTSGLQH